MDRGGRFPEPLDDLFEVEGTRSSSSRSWTGFRRQHAVRSDRPRTLSEQLVRPGVGWLGVALLFGVTGIYGTTAGDHWGELGELAQSAPEAFARSGFTITQIAVDGRKALTNDELLEALNYEPGQSLVSLDVAAAREALLRNPLIQQATVRKLYPDQITIKLVERQPFALWQQGEALQVISADGTVIEGLDHARFGYLPLVVGRDANLEAQAISKALEPHPELRERIYAAVRVGGRRWNLRLKNGMDVKLPDEGVEAALTQLVDLERSYKITDRDITELDLRFPNRATVRLSEPAAEALAEAAKGKAKRAGT
jgi:cell division protein FtsQ